jgi:hypothetical protein
MLISLVLAVAVTILAVFFATYNLTVIHVNLFGYPVTGTVGVIIVVALGMGVLLGVVLMLPALISRSWALMRHKRKIQDLQGGMQQKHFEDSNEE